MPRSVNNAKQGFANVNTVSKTVGETVTTLSEDGRTLTNGVQILANGDNAGVVYVGVRSNLTAGDNDATDGFPLSAGNSLLLPARHEYDVYLIASAADQKIHALSF